ncbi:MAG: aminoacyl-tRNA hydrolase [Alphaproteobacteria bacterium]|nr:aminoacyl-tRNA hydrolase [Alphaproteobacteria bacterium]
MSERPQVPAIPDELLEFRFVRSSGPGGQNVNKVASAVQLRFRPDAWDALSAGARERLRRIAGRRLAQDGSILIDAREHRTQEANRRAALARLHEMIEQALIVPKRRRATRPTLASRERRLKSKKLAAAHKAGRGRGAHTDE